MTHTIRQQLIRSGSLRPLAYVSDARPQAARTAIEARQRELRAAPRSVTVVRRGRALAKGG